jgi:hypothetical protein
MKRINMPDPGSNKGMIILAVSTLLFLAYAIGSVQ